MRAVDDIRSAWKWLGVAGRIFVAALIASWATTFLGGSPLLRMAFNFLATGAGIVLMFRIVRSFIRQSIWRLRNRLIVAYLFIALVPILLMGTLAMIAIWTVSGQTAIYLVTSEFNRKLEGLQHDLQNIQREPVAGRASALERHCLWLRESHPDLEIISADNDSLRFPRASKLKAPRRHAKGRGIIAINGEYFGWTDATGADGSRIAAVFPITREFLVDLVPGLGNVSLVNLFDRKIRLRASKSSGTIAAGTLPPAQNFLDLELLWFGPVRVMHYETGEDTQDGTTFAVSSRISALWRVLTSEVELENAYVLSLIFAVALAFFLVELAALIVGVSLSRSITASVHNLYEGTERVMEGEFSHRIRVLGRDQLAALGHSFNRMTENLERLLKVAKEKERYEAELEIAREIQKQLYPKSVPESAQMKLVALYKPARMVSGDYYDYRRLDDSKIAIAIGDVAGKGISAALLMATVQSGFRSQLQLASSNGGHSVGTSLIVSRLNEQLHANTPPEKFATFFVGVFDETTSTLHYTNAGHLQPILIRDGQAKRLEVDGMVIGAFPFARYGESQMELLPGDLLVCFTDGISEPENEYGEMFGEDRLVELVLKNASRSEEQIVQTIIEAVEKWTGSPELQDDMTLLVARRKSS